MNNYGDWMNSGLVIIAVFVLCLMVYLEKEGNRK